MKILCWKEVNSEVEVKYFMTTLGFSEKEERLLQFDLKLESAGLSTFSNKLGVEVEA